MNKIIISVFLMSLFFIGSSYANSFGWNKKFYDGYIKGCTDGMLDSVKKEFIAMEIDNGNPNAIFPEDELKPSITEYCSCITKRASVSIERKKLQKDPKLLKPIASEALAGGRCKPTGAFGKLYGF